MPKYIDEAVKEIYGKYIVNVEQFRERVGDPDPVTGCMTWRGPGWHAQGYGMVMVWNAVTGKRTMALTHRLTYMMNVDANLTRNQFVLHTCSNHACCNPDHLVCGDGFARERFRAANKGPRKFKHPGRLIAKQPWRTYKFSDSQLVYAHYHTWEEIVERWVVSREDASQMKYMAGPRGYPWLQHLLPLYNTEGQLLSQHGEEK